MPKFAMKTYGRTLPSGTDVFASKAFDDVVQSKPTSAKGGVATKAATKGVARWGKTAFTSKRNALEDDTQSCSSPADSMFEDPFSFDSDDEGPSAPKKGIGLKNSNNEKPSPAPQGSRPNAGGSSKLAKDENNDEKDTLKRAPSKTYSRPKVGSNGETKQKQLSMDTFMKKPSTSSQSKPLLSKTYSANQSLVITLSQSSSTSQGFVSSQGVASSEGFGSSQVGASSTSNKDTFLFDSDNEYNSDDNAPIESDDPEIIFNSPIKKREARELLAPTNVLDDLMNLDSPSVISSDNDTDSVCSAVSSNKGALPEKSKSEADTGVVKGKFFSGYRRSKSDIKLPKDKEALKRKWENISSKISLESERKKEKGEPMVRRLLTNSPKKGTTRKVKAQYNARQWHDSDLDEEANANSGPDTPTATNSNSYDFDEPKLLNKDIPQLRRKVKESDKPGWDPDVTALKTGREYKPLYTVVRNVKAGHECQEVGEAQEFEDEVNYILSGLGDNMRLAVRCLSTLSLAMNSVSSSFRMHLRAHGTLDKILDLLHDSYKYPALALSTSAVLYLVSRDRFSMDLERAHLQLMLNLLSVDSEDQVHEDDSEELHRAQEKVTEICDKLKKQGNVKVELEDINVNQLAVETLLSLTSKTAGEWFKEELRVLKGLDHIIETVGDCVDGLDEFSVDPTESMINKLQKIERCLRVLENVTYLNKDNQNYLVSYKSCILVTNIYRTLKVCENCLPFNTVETIEKNGETKPDKECPGYILFSTLLAIFRTLLNLTHDNQFGCTKVGQESGFIRTVLYSLMKFPQFIPASERFDLLVLGLGTLINLVEHCDHNRETMVQCEVVRPYDEDQVSSKFGGKIPALEAVMMLFNMCYAASKRHEEEHDAELEVRQAEKKRKKEEEKASNAGMGILEKSGEWHESESGLEWVPQDKMGTESQNGSQSETDLAMEVLQPSQDDDETLTKALHRAGKHMEDSIVAAYTSLLVGCTIEGNQDLIDTVREQLPEGDFEPMVRMLKKFLGFMNFTTVSGSTTGEKSLRRIIGVLEAC